MQVIHYGAPEYNPALFKPISNRYSRNKPEGGLWTSPVGSEFGWYEWCIEEGFSLHSLDSGYFLLTVCGNILTIDSYDDLGRLPWISDERNYSHIDFESIDYDAIHLTIRGELKTRFSSPRDLYGWDFETVLILNPSAIKQSFIEGQFNSL